MKKETLILIGIVALVFTLAGCSVKEPKDKKVYVDLNGDGVKDIVYVWGEREHWNADTYYFIVAKLSNPEKTYGERIHLLKLNTKPYELKSMDFDDDGDQDLVFSVFGKNPGTFVAENDGMGKIINTRKISG